MKRRRLNIKKVNQEKRPNTEKQNVKLMAAAAKIIAALALEARWRKKSRKNARQKKIKCLNILKKIKVILGRKQ